jgi:plasmid stability protein
MAKTIQIRGVPDEVHRELRSRAAAAGMSLSDYARQELERVAAYPPLRDVLLSGRARASGVSSEDIAAAIRAGRDA